MAKQQINRKETKVATQEGVGQQYEQVVTVDDNLLPTAKELADYKAIDPRIVDFLLQTSTKEQAHRHKIEGEKIRIVKKAERRITVMNWLGMFFAFLTMAFFIGLAAFALYLDKPWFAGLSAFATMITCMSLFIDRDKKGKKQ